MYNTTYEYMRSAYMNNSDLMAAKYSFRLWLSWQYDSLDIAQTFLPFSNYLRKMEWRCMEEKKFFPFIRSHPILHENIGVGFLDGSVRSTVKNNSWDSS